MSIKYRILLCIVLLIAAYFGRNYWLKTPDHDVKHETVKFEIAPGSRQFETRHYVISSTAMPQQTVLVSEAVESLHSAYAEFFKGEIRTDPDAEKLKLVLYGNREEFSVNNKSSSWAEAYYRTPVCYAYYSDEHPNPYHWMIHEATHQLNNEVAHFKIPKWVNEGLASYFGTSKIEAHKLLPGSIDKNTYPIWWLTDLSLSGNLQKDIDNGKIIPLRFILEGKGGPDINQNVNLYYIEYWSLTHFLFHYENGIYADNYKKLIAEGTSLDKFEQIIGPLDQIEAEWYDYLRQRAAETRSQNGARDDDIVEISL